MTYKKQGKTIVVFDHYKIAVNPHKHWDVNTTKTLQSREFQKRR